MKKFILGVLIITGCVGASKSQNAESLPIRKGQNSVNFYYGYSLSQAFYEAALGGSIFGFSTKVLGPVGLVYEHMMTDVVGLGGEFGYSRLTLSYDETQFFTNKTFHSEWIFTVIRAQVRVNLHFSKSEKFDAYGFANAGYRHRQVEFSSDDPFFDPFLFRSEAIPIGTKAGLGIRYFFTDNFGLNMEIALGTPILCGGLSFKF